MDKHILEQYTDLQAEEKDIRRRLDKLQREIDRMELEGCQVADSVTCGKKGKKPLGTVRVQGFPHPEYQRKLKRRMRLKNQLEDHDEQLLELLQQVQQYIQAIADSRIRRIMQYRFIDDMTWVQVAHRMGGKHTADSCRQAIERHLGLRK